MIKATELRIGNKIKIGNVITTVTGGHLDYCGDKTEVKEFYPIPLTPEILEKIGFKKDHNHLILGFPVRMMIVFNDGNPAELDIMQDGKFVSFKHGHLKSLHQLQNLYFALAGEELVIKELTPA